MLNGGLAWLIGLPSLIIILWLTGYLRRRARPREPLVLGPAPDRRKPLARSCIRHSKFCERGSLARV